MGNGSRRRMLAEEALAGYVHGPTAATEATTLALERVAALEPDTVVLVEGISDQMAVEAAAERRGRDLGGEGVVVVPVGGAQAVPSFLRRLGTGPGAFRLVGLCDAAEEEVFLLGLERAGIASPRNRGDLARLGFHTCVEDLEDELIRALGVTEVEALLDSQGDLRSFRTLQKQPAWRDRPHGAQLRRFLGSGARRKLRYARLMAGALEPGRLPTPLLAVLDDT